MEVIVVKRNYDYSKLRGRIIEKLGSIQKYAELLGISDSSLVSKLDNRIPFSQDEILKSIDSDLLDLDISDIPIYFFTKKVANIPTKVGR